MPYLLLTTAILTEVLGTTCLKLSNGFTRFLPAVGVVIGYLLSFALLALVLKTLPVGTVYAIWSAAGTALIAAIGITFFGESAAPLKIAGMVLVILGVVVLNLAGEH
jgi:small multidrug resistance pump